MQNDLPKEYNSTTHGNVPLSKVIEYIKLFLEEEPIASYTLVIGSDSQERKEPVNGKRFCTIITTVVVHRKGFGGKYFWIRQTPKEIHSLREKIYAETLSSLEFAAGFVPLLKKSLNGHSPNYYLEIHVDIGEHGETRDMIKEIVGMVTGNGFVAKTKPESFGASYIADRHT